MSDAENTTREKLIAVLAGSTSYFIHHNVRVRMADALIAAFPVLTTEPNETTMARLTHAELLISEVEAAGRETDAGDWAWWRRRAIGLAKELSAVLAVVPKSTETQEVVESSSMRTLKFARLIDDSLLAEGIPVMSNHVTFIIASALAGGSWW